MAIGNLILNQQSAVLSAHKRVVNDFSINISTVNGSGSQSANSVLMKSIFGMGVPVGGKNLFPSNIAGEPTWFLIRASKDGYLGRKRDSEILVALNSESAQDDLRALPAGGVVIYEETLNLESARDDVFFYPVPLEKITAAVSGGNLSLSWPAVWTGLHLQVQTNTLANGLGTNWVTIPGSDASNSYVAPIVRSTNNPSVFYRLAP